MGRDVIEQVAMVTGRILHEGTGLPLRGQVSIAVREDPLVHRMLEDGTFVLSGDLRRLFPLVPGPARSLNLTIRADSPQYRRGFTVQDQLVTIPAGWMFREPWDAGTIRLSAERVTIRGRVVEASNPATPVFNARVDVLPPRPMASELTDAEGRYRLGEVAVLPTDQIRCREGSRTVTRPLRVDFTQSFHEEYFRLPMP